MEEEVKVQLLSEIASLEENQEWEHYSTKMSFFDKITNGWFKDWDLIVISALSGMGKTSMSQTMSINFAEQWIPVLFFSYEVLVSHLWSKFKDMQIKDDAPIYSMVRNSTGNVWWIEEKIIEAKEEFWVKVIVIDHLWFLLPKSTLKDISQNYSVYVWQIIRELKNIAKAQNVVIVLPVHLRKTAEPSMNDLAHSAAISQESDMVILMDREKAPANSSEYYTEHTKVMVVKNRSTGQTSQWWFQMVSWRFMEDPFYVPNQDAEANKRAWKWF